MKTQLVVKDRLGVVRIHIITNNIFMQVGNEERISLFEYLLSKRIEYTDTQYC